jgi:acetamidase/formamidase
MSTHHTLRAGPDTCHWGYFDAALKPVLAVASGDTVSVDCVSGAPDVLPAPPLEVLPEHRAIHATLKPLMGSGHILTGPIAIEGAEPGDTLEIRIRTIDFRQNWGWTRIAPLRGTIPEDFPMRKMWHTAIDRQRGVGTTPFGMEIPLAPFFGVMGVAPKPVYGPVTTIIPREFGGNLDLKELVAGTTLYLPIWTKGGLFSVGDGHGAQGDGEVCTTALETALSGTFELILRKDLHLDMPRAETPSHHITLGLDEDLDDAAKQALRQMIKLLGELAGIAPEDAYMLCSLGVDFRVTQLVDGNKGIHGMLAKSLLAQPHVSRE